MKGDPTDDNCGNRSNVRGKSEVRTLSSSLIQGIVSTVRSLSVVQGRGALLPSYLTRQRPPLSPFEKKRPWKRLLLHIFRKRCQIPSANLRGAPSLMSEQSFAVVRRGPAIPPVAASRERALPKPLERRGHAPNSAGEAVHARLQGLGSDDLGRGGRMQG